MATSAAAETTAAAVAGFDIAAVKADLDERGVAVVPGVIAPEVCDDYVKEIRQWLDQFGASFPRNINSIIHKYGLAHHPVAWKVRHAARPVFEQLWGTEKLLTSLDGMAIGQPPEEYNTKFHVDDAQEGFHHDQGPHRVGLHGYQGAVYLEEATEEDWCFQVLEGSHLHFTDFFNQSSPGKHSEFRKINATERKWLTEAGCPGKRIAVPKGGIVLWDSRTVHAGAPPVYGRDNPGRWRYISFVCMAPAQWATQEDIQKKITGYKKVQCSNHWPTNSIKFFPSGRATPYDFTDLPAEARTDEAKQLVGQLPYDFEDDKPNGPPKPIIAQKE